jgi:hypothetical protein
VYPPQIQLRIYLRKKTDNLSEIAASREIAVPKLILEIPLGDLRRFCGFMTWVFRRRRLLARPVSD